MFRPIMTTLFCMGLFFSLIGLSADPALSDPAPEKQVKAEAALPENPYLAKIEAKTKELGEKLQKPEVEHLYFIREGFGVTRAVKVVRRDVSAAVKACAKANPDMKDPIQKRFDEWAGMVDPVLAAKEKEIDAAVTGQTYAKPKEIKDYLKLIEQAADHANKSIDKQIVTTPDACESLQRSMDKTQEIVSELLSDVELLPWPPEEDEADKKENAGKMTLPN